MKQSPMKPQNFIREEELKNRVATLYFGKYDCDRIVGNIDFCILPRWRDPRQMVLIPDAFGYNERGEVVLAQIGANSFTHAYDYIGNQTNFAANAATNTFTHNNLNQMEPEVK